MKVEEGGGDINQLGLGMEGHPEGNPMVAEEEEGEGGYNFFGGGKPTLLHVTEWMCKRLGSSLAAKATTFPWTRERVRRDAPPPPECLHPKVPTPPSTPFRGCCNASFGSSCTPRPRTTVGGAGRMGMHQAELGDVGDRAGVGAHNSDVFIVKTEVLSD